MSLKEKLLMHVCCGPCAVWPVTYLKNIGEFEISGLFYNPNIHPMEEFDTRKLAAKDFFAGEQLPLEIDNSFMQREWEAFDMERIRVADEEERRCEMCYRIRLHFVAQKAQEQGFDAFTTSLLVSPYQKHEMICAIAEEAAAKHRVRFYYHDFRPHFREGQKMAKELGLYRQKYCGCILSKTTDR